MLKAIHPKLPMRSKATTRDFYIRLLGFSEFGDADYPGYLMVQKDQVQIHFFEFRELNPAENYGQVYIRTDSIDALYQSFEKQAPSVLTQSTPEVKPWGQIEFSILDPDNNLLTFGQSLE